MRAWTMIPGGMLLATACVTSDPTELDGGSASETASTTDAPSTTGVFVAGAHSPWRDSAIGDGWVDLGDSGLTSGRRAAPASSRTKGGLFVIGGGGGGTSDLVLSGSDGDDWWHPQDFPAQCGDSIRGIARGGGAVRRSPRVCRWGRWRPRSPCGSHSPRRAS